MGQLQANNVKMCPVPPHCDAKSENQRESTQAKQKVGKRCIILGRVCEKIKKDDHCGKSPKHNSVSPCVEHASAVVNVEKIQ